MLKCEKFLGQLTRSVLKIGEMLKMLKVLWGIDPPPTKNKLLKIGEMLKMLKNSRNIFLSA